MESKGNESQIHQRQPQKRQQSLERQESNFSINPTNPGRIIKNDSVTIISAAPTLTTAATISSPTTFSSGIVSSSSGSSINQQKTNHRMQQFHSPQPQPSQHFRSSNPKQLQQQNTITTPISSIVVTSSSFAGSGSDGSGNTTVGAQQTFEKLSRPAAFDKMESLVREMQDPENGVPVRQQKIFLTSIPYAFMGYDLIEWLMDRLLIEESEALNIANQLCLHGYFFPVNDTKTLVVKDDSSLYRFQTPYYWPWQHKAPDNVEYAIYLAKRSLRNKQRHGLEDYELDALSSLHKNLKGKWDIISMQAEEQVRLAKDRKKGDKIVGDSQERAYWRVHRPPPGQFTPLEPCPIPTRDRQGAKAKRKTLEDAQRELEYLKKSINRTRMKMSKACECLVAYAETFAEYDAFLQPPLPSNPWVTEDTTFWQLNSTYVETPTEKRVRRWAISIEELVNDPTGLQEFTNFLEKEYSHENIRFWNEVNCLRRSAHSQVSRKANKIYEEFLMPGAPCEINIDSKTMASVLQALCNPSRFTFDSASEHIYTLLLKKDCYPRFIRSDHYKRLLENGAQPLHKKRFFNFGGVGGAKKKMTAALSGPTHSGEATTLKAVAVAAMSVPPPGNLTRRRGSDRSLTGSAHELTVIGVNKDAQANNVPHSHSQSNLSEMPYREASKSKLPTRLESTAESVDNAVCPWDLSGEFPLPTPAVSKSLSSQSTSVAQILDSSIKTTRQPLGTTSTTMQLSVCPWETNVGTPLRPISDASLEVAGITERLQRSMPGLRHQNTVDSGETRTKHLIPSLTEQRRASMSFTPSRLADHQLAHPTHFKTISCPSPTLSSQIMESAITSLTPNLGELVSVVATSIDGTLNALEEEKQLPVSPSPLSSSNSNNSLKKVTESISDDLNRIEDKDQTIPQEPVIEQPISEIEIELIETTDFIDPCQSPQHGHEPLAHKAHSSGDQTSRSTTPTPTITVQGYPLQLAVNPCSTNSKTTSPKYSRTIDTSHNSVEDHDARKIVDMNSPKVLMTQVCSNKPPPIPPIGPVEEEQLVNANNDEDDDDDDVGSLIQEDLSPASDEYQEGIQFGKDGYIAPAPTPTPSVAPLAVLDVDTVDDEYVSEENEAPLKLLSPSHSTISSPPAKVISIASTSEEEGKKRRKKRNSESKSRLASLEEKEKITPSATVEDINKDTVCNAVCPWEDENATTTDGTFVKTYATLGYL